MDALSHGPLLDAPAVKRPLLDAPAAERPALSPAQLRTRGAVGSAFLLLGMLLIYLLKFCLPEALLPQRLATAT